MISDLFKDTKPSRQVLTLLLTLVFFMLLSMLTMGALAAFGVDVLDVAVQRNLQLLSQLLMFACPALLCTLFFETDLVGALCLKMEGGRLMLILLGVVAMALIIPIAEWLTRWNDGWHLPQSLATFEASLRRMGEMSSDTVRQFLMLPGPKNLLLNLLILALMPALCEELFFRASLLRILLKWSHKPWVAIVVSAVVFSLAHGELFAFVPRFFLGLVLGMMFCYSQCLWVSVAAHFLNNAVVVVAYYLFREGLSTMNPEAGFDVSLGLSILLMAVALLVLGMMRKSRSKEQTQSIG